jgi:PAS domain S-box-containing protein
VKRYSKGLSVSNRLPPTSESTTWYDESSSYLQAIIDSLEDELMVIDTNYRIVQANEAVLTRHQKPRQAVIGRYCYDVSHGLPELCRPPHHECPIKAVWETGKPARVTHLHLYSADKEKRERYLDIIASPITDKQGNIIAVTELMRDVTDAKKLELEVAEAHRYLSAMNAVAGVVNQSLELDTVLSSALDKTLQIMRQDTGGILLIDQTSQMLCYRVHQGLPKESVRAVCCRLGEGISGKVAQTGEPIVIADISTDPRAAQIDVIAKDGLRSLASVPLRSKERILGVINIASRDACGFSDRDIQLLESVATQIAIAIENAKLHQQVQRQDESRGELLREIFSIQEEERRRIARELHDETSQTLAILAASLEAVADLLPAGSDEVKTKLGKLQSLSINILDGIHKLIYELRPTLLDDLGLVAAIRWLAENNLKAAGVALQFRIIGQERRLSSQLETTLFRVVQETIYNIAKHARAKKASVQLRFKRDSVIVKVKDDGRGFDVNEAISSKERPRGLGLLGMKERVELFNGSFSIRSCPDGGGTEIDIQIRTK